ncbi:MAG TPA: hypothetical protein VMD27_07585 [Candidatus Aquilonibacter sp.]|nr:hypothetical protein [Candidatus Aquilonibacter sp.]
MATTEQCAAALGEMTMAFQELENKLLELFASVTNKDPMVGLIIGSQLSFRKLCDTTEAICRHKTDDKEMVKEISAIVKKCSQLETHRNTYIHSYYASFSFEDGDEVYARSKHKIKRGKGFSSDCDSHDPEKLRDLAFDMGSEVRRINEFLDWLREERIIGPKPPDSPFY